MDINEKVLAAFQAEHKEQLEGIRALLAELDDDETVDLRGRIDEAFRLAHSLKGGARVCDLHPAETLAHRLESVFAQVRGGNLRLDADVVKTINYVLDAIEDWMSALNCNAPPADPRQALAAIERLLGVDSEDVVGGPTPEDSVAQRLVQAFCSECPQYLERLHRFCQTVDDGTSELATEAAAEAFRLAHNLRGSAQAAEIGSIETVAAAMEATLAAWCNRDSLPDAATLEQMRQQLGEIETELQGLTAAGGSAVTVDAGSRTRASSAEPLVPRLPLARNLETVRISTESLDTILRSSRQLAGESALQEQVSRGLKEICRQVDAMQREREAIRRVVSASLHRPAAVPESDRLTAYFETVDRGLESLTRATRQLCAVQKRNAWRLQSCSAQIQQNVRQARMVPAEEVFQGMRKLVRDLARAESKQVEFHVSGFDVRADRMVFQSLKDPLIHILRNCIVHGLESPAERTAAGKCDTCRIDLRISTVGNRLTIEVDDDGRGIDCEKISLRAVERGLVSQSEVVARPAEEMANLIFQPGFTTANEITELAGRGMGLSVVRDAVTRLQGEVTFGQRKCSGTTFHISVPTCVSTHRLLIVSASDDTYAIPLYGIARLLRVPASELETIGGKPIVTFDDRPLPLISLSSVLGGGDAGVKVNGGTIQIAILKSATRLIAVTVDVFVEERDLLIQDLDSSAASERLLGAVLLEDGQPALVLNPGALAECAVPAAREIVVENVELKAEQRTPRVLVVDDSFTTRTLEKGILEANGYYVGIAVDGVEGLQHLSSEHYDLVISDIEMPRMDGFKLLERIRADKRLSSTPVILVTSRSRREDQERGLELGADAYIVKQKFDHQSLLDTIRQVVTMKN